MSSRAALALPLTDSATLAILSTNWGGKLCLTRRAKVNVRSPPDNLVTSAGSASCIGSELNPTTPAPMKITAIETIVCHARMRNWIFVKVLTDQPGLWGWGEATLEWHTRSVVGAIEDLSQLLIGEDPSRVEHLWQMMWRQHFWHGQGIVRSTAIAGIDLALWDIVGKIAQRATA